MTRKITRAVSKIVLGLQSVLYMGNLNARRDWGHAKDYVKAMWLILQQDVAEDYVIATGITTKVRDFISMAFAHIGFSLRWEGEGVEEVGILDSIDEKKYVSASGQSLNLPISNLLNSTLVKVDPRYFRPTEVELLIGDATKAFEKLGWKHETSSRQLAAEMVAADLVTMQDAPLGQGA